MNEVDPLPIIISLVSLVLLLCLSALFSATETAVMSLSKIRLEHLTKENTKKARRLKKITNSPEVFLQTVLVGNNLINTAASALATFVAMQLFASSGVGIATGVMTFLILIFAEITPKNIARQKPEKIALSFSILIYGAIIILTPLFFVVENIKKLSKKILKTKNKIEDAKLSEEELKILIEVGEEEGVIKNTQKKMLTNILAFSDLSVKEIMTPRTDIHAIKGEMSYSALLEFSKEYGISRFPYYEKNLDDILGIITIRDLINFSSNDKDFSIKKILKPAIFVFESKSISKLQEELIEKGQNIAIVVDEYGGTSGLVTLKDIEEEVFGSIADEYDKKKEFEYKKIAENSFEIDASMRLSFLQELTDTEFISDDSETVAGFVLEKHGDIPQVGTIVIENGWVFCVEEIEERRITQLKVYKLEEKNTDE